MGLERSKLDQKTLSGNDMQFKYGQGRGQNVGEWMMQRIYRQRRAESSLTMGKPGRVFVIQHFQELLHAHSHINN